MTEKMLVPPTNYLEAMGMIDGMRAEIDRLHAEIATMKTAELCEISRLRAENASLKAEIDWHVEERDRLREALRNATMALALKAQADGNEELLNEVRAILAKTGKEDN